MQINHKTEHAFTIWGRSLTMVSDPERNEAILNHNGEFVELFRMVRYVSREDFAEKAAENIDWWIAEDGGERQSWNLVFDRLIAHLNYFADRAESGERAGGVEKPSDIGKPDRSGEKNNLAKLTEEQVREIRASGETHVEAAKRYGLSANNVYLIRTRKTWKHVV